MTVLLTETQIDIMDKAAVAWLVDCTIADGRGDKVTKFSDYLNGKETRELTMRQLLAINPAADTLITAILEGKI